MLSAILLCLSINLYHEARGTDLEEYYAISNVVMNRVESKRFPNDVCSVIEQPVQFSWTSDHKMEIPKFKNPIDENAWEEIKLFSSWFLNAYYSGGTYDITNGSTYYAKSDMVPWWSKDMDIELVSYAHTYYKEEKNKDSCIVGSDELLNLIDFCPTIQLTFKEFNYD